MLDILRDQYGRYQIEAEEKFDGKTFQWRKYENSPKIKRLGGQYANYCINNGDVKFYRNSCIRDRAFPKFIDKQNYRIEVTSNND